jgi:phage shock protein PspC (stress-responsive transcriptional regulator)
MGDKWLSRTGWFVLIWVLSVLALGIVAYAIRLAIVP